jgi:hypothetical protein
VTEHASIASQIAQLQGMTVDQLRGEYERVFGEQARSRNKTWLWRRIAWRIQELAFGGLSERAKARLEELMPDAEVALRVPPGRFLEARDRAVRLARDPRPPSPGTVLLRNWRGRRIVVEVTEEGFLYEGVVYKSLSAAARAITGTRWNGPLFFGLTGKKKAAK